MDHRVFQIYYDDASKRALSPLLIPLDNSGGARPEWFEFWPIRQYLLDHQLEDGCWYGFLSPKFEEKFGLGIAQLLNILNLAVDHEDVMLLSPHWDQGAYFTNAFEQGEFWIPGLLEASQMFLDALGGATDLRRLVANSQTTVFSNYFVAKAAFWRDWLELADALFACSEDRSTPVAQALNAPTGYGSRGRPVLMKTFVQERLACVLLERRIHRVGVIDLSDTVPLTSTLFKPDPGSRRRLQACDLMKHEYASTGDPTYLSVYARLRASVPTLKLAPMPSLLGA